MRVLFCGLGGIGQRHLRNLRSLVPPEQLNVHAYRVLGRNEKLRDDLSIEADRNIVADYNIIVHSDIENAFAIQPQAVFICNPSSLHTQIALRAANAGAHIFIEKPVSNSMEGMDELLAIVKAKRLVCYIGYNFRFHTGLKRIKELLEQGHFGTLLAVHSEIGEYLPNWHRYEDYRNMYAARSDLGGGVIFSQIHEMDLIYWYFGLPASIYCLGGKLSKLEIDVEDTASSLMQYDGNKGRFPIMLHQDYVQRPPERTFKIIGDQSVALIDLVKNNLTVYNVEGEAIEQWDGAGFKRNNMFQAQMQHFLDCVAGQATPLVNLEDGMQSMRLALAAKESLVRKTVVYLNQEPSA